MSRAPPHRPLGQFMFALVLLLLLVALAPNALAANDPGHDSLYVLRIGDTNVTGTINLTGNVTATIVQATSRFFGPNVDIRGDGTSSGNANQIIGTATNLELSSSGNLILNKAVTGGMVYIGWLGTTTALNVTGNILGAGTLNVSGHAYANGAQVCTSSNGLCAGAGASSSAGGWVNDSTSTRTTLRAIVNSSSNTGSFIVQNTTGAPHLFVNGSNGYVTVGNTTPLQQLTVEKNISAQGLYIGGLNAISLETDVNNQSLYVTSVGPQYFSAQSAGIIMNIASSGVSVPKGLFVTENVSVGTVAGTSKLNVGGSANITGATYLGNSKCSAGQALTTDSATGLISCVSLSGSSSAGGWTNNSVSTRTTLQTIVNSSNITGSFIVQNQTGSTHLFVNGSSGFVGIGTGVPLSGLHMRNGSLFVEGTGAAPATLVGSVFLWDANKSALRAGFVENDEWNAEQVAEYSVALGIGTIANGTDGATALGISTIANGSSGATALGMGTRASGDYGATALGIWTAADGTTGATALGFVTTASGEAGATALGYNTLASGDYGATALGSGTTASGDNGATALGVSTIANGTDGATALGIATTASGNDGATAIGSNTIANGNRGTTAIGDGTTASGNYGATAIGFGTVANGDYGATALGYLTIASGTSAVAIGSLVDANADSSVVIGSGLNESEHLNNTIPNTLMIGFNSSIPTVFVNGSAIGIGTTKPTAKLTVNSSDRTGSLLIINTSGSTHLFVNGTSGQIGFGTSAFTGTALTEFRSADSSKAQAVFRGGNEFDGSAFGGEIIIGDPGAVAAKIAYVYSSDKLKVEVPGARAIEFSNGGYGTIMYLQGGSNTVGIGTNGGTATLHVNSSSNYGSLLIQNTTGNTHLFVNGSNGYVGIGTSKPTQALYVNGSVEVNNGNLTVSGRSLSYQNAPVLSTQDYFCDFLTAQATTMCSPNYLGAPVGAGTSASVPGNRSIPGAVSMNSGSAANTGYRYQTDVDALLLNGSEVFSATMTFPTLANRNTSVILIGFSDSTTQADATDGVYFIIINNTMLGAKTANNNVFNSTNTSGVITNLTLYNNNWYTLTLRVNPNGSGAEFRVYNATDNIDTLLWNATLTNNVPTSPGRETGAGALCIMTSAGTAQVICSIDQEYAAIPVTRRRITW